MSEKIDIIIDSSTDVEAGNEIVSASTDNNIDIEILEPDYNVTINKREYVITGDNLYIPKTYDESPQWLKDIIGTITDFSLNQKLTEIGALSSTLYGLIDELNVAKNTYTMSIINSAEIDERINARVETLNSSLSGSDATIVDLIATKATPTEASSLALNVLTASINDGAISSLVSNLQTAISTVNSAISTNIDIVHAEMTGEFEGTAEAIGGLRTYVGVSNDGGITGTGLLANVEILQKQNDGIIETTADTYDVMINPQDPNLAQLVVAAKPYATWKAADVTGINTRLAHIGDVYVKYADTANGAKEYIASYKFIRTVIDETSPYATDSDGFTWALIVDQAAQDAYEQALNAYDLADNKRRVFTITPSGPYDEGDLWVRIVSGSNHVWKCQVTRAQLDYYNAADWSIASTDDTATVALQTGLADGTVTVKLTNAYVGTTPFLTYLTNEIDSNVGVYSGEIAPVAGQPSGVAANDIYLWFTTASKVLANGTTQVYDITRTYKYSGSAWIEITTDSNITALADLADGKRTVFSGNTVPVGAVARDIWIPSATNGSYLQGEIYQYSGSAWIVATKYSADIKAVRSNLQSQVDGKVETYYKATVPTGMTSVNNGDYWYCTTDVSTYKKGKVYKYVHATTSWVETADVSRYAFDTADGKASIFTSTNVPTTGYKVNDMLIVIDSFNNGTTTFSDGVVLSSSANRVSGFTASDWVKKINDTEDLDAFVSNTYTPAVASLQSQVDSKIESWYTVSTIDPKTAWTTAELKLHHNGDMWYQTDTKKSYWYSSSTHSWNLIDDAKAIKALANAATAQATADGVVVSFYAIKQDTAPATTSLWLNKTGTKVLKRYTTSWVNVVVKVGDTLTAYDPITKDTSLYVYNGTGWITNTENGIVAGSEAITTLTANLATTNTTVGGHTTQLNTVDTRIANGVASVETKWAYNSVVNINGASYQSGFGLATSLTSGSGLPTGASEFWIKADKFKLLSADGSKKSSYSPFSVDTTTGAITFNGKVTFSNVTDVPSLNSGSNNLLYNSAPTIGIETKGWQADYNTTGMASSGVLASPDPYRPTGGGGFYQSMPGTPATGKVFDIRAVGAIPVIGGQFYEGSAYLNSHRCDSQIYVGWRDSAGATITWSIGDIVTQTNAGSVLSTWGRSKFIVQAPANSVSCYYYIRGISIGQANPYVFVSMCYFGRASEGQTVYSNWSEGTSASLSSSDVSAISNAGVASNNDVFAQKLGYASYNAMIAAASTGQTIINGGYINTDLIQANAIVANQINTIGLIAENISANEITGKTFTGGVINGARINGAVIKASYLDLDGELEVLTNYRISVAMYNASPSTYSDAVYISADNEYRIPSISSISSLEKVVSSSSSPWVAVGSYTLSSGLYSYATANVGHNMKAVKSRPSVINFSESGYSGSLSSNTLYSAVFDGTTSGYFKFSIGNLLILSLTISNTSVSYSGLVGSGSIAATVGGTTTVNLSYCGMSFVVNRAASYGMRITVAYLGNTNMAINSDWTSGQIYVTSNSVLNQSGQNTLIGLRLPAISINNMV